MCLDTPKHRVGEKTVQNNLYEMTLGLPLICVWMTKNG